MFSLHQSKKKYTHIHMYVHMQTNPCRVTLIKYWPQFLCYHSSFFGIKTTFERHRDHASYLLFTASTSYWKILHFFPFIYMSWLQSVLLSDLILHFTPQGVCFPSTVTVGLECLFSCPVGITLTRTQLFKWMTIKFWLSLTVTSSSGARFPLIACCGF